jgi:sugar O-acyltransferase (sialic acid O-acetyltransferase NeuD family)
VDRDETKVGLSPGRCGHRVIATEDVMLDAVQREGHLPAGATFIALGIGDNRARSQCIDVLQERMLPVLIHESATVSPSATIGYGSVILPRSVINADATIGRGVIINSGAIIEHDCSIGDGVHVSPGAVLVGGVRVGKRSWIGASAVVIDAVAVGDDAMVGAGAVVIRDVPAGFTVVGNPARHLRS